MGCFDDIACDAMRCPLCGSEMGWQSKDGPCTLETLTVHELMDETSKPVFYSSCDDCRVWVEVSIHTRTGRTDAQRAQMAKERAIVEEKRRPKYPRSLGDFFSKPEEAEYHPSHPWLIRSRKGWVPAGTWDGSFEPPADQPPRGEDP